MKRLLSEAEAAEMLGISGRTLQRMRVEGGGPAFARLGARRIAYPADALADWIARRTYAHRAAERSADRRGEASHG